jgi:hypothetical protein
LGLAVRARPDAAISPTPATIVQNGWSVTGDAIRMRMDIFIRRTRRRIISSGYNIAGEVEAALLTHEVSANAR